MGRGWAILEGGNRGDVLMRSARAVRYGDLRVRNAMGEDGPRCELKGDDSVMEGATTEAACTVSSMPANRVRFSR